MRTIEERLQSIERLLLLNAKQLLTIDEVALITNLSVQHLYRLTSGRKIPHYKRGGKLYFDRKEIEGWLKEERVETEEEIQTMARTYRVINNNERIEK